RMVDRAHPGVADRLDRTAHAGRVNLRRSGERADHHRHVVAAALAVGDVAEQEGAALLFRHAADELPAHQRMQLGILVDRPGDAHKETSRGKIGKVLLEIEPRPGCVMLAVERLGLIKHMCGPASSLYPNTMPVGLGWVDGPAGGRLSGELSIVMTLRFFASLV